MTKNDHIIINKAKVHNLKNISLEIPKNAITVITGPSGSGKSSLAFDTLFAEGQRRYIESLSTYAKQFIGKMQPPDVESISGLSPSISIDQKSITQNPRSTVGTTTEIFDYLRLLFSKIGDLYCIETGDKIFKSSPNSIVKSILSFEHKTKIQILAPLIHNKKGDFTHELSKCSTMGFSKVYINKILFQLSDKYSFDKQKNYSIDLVVDRVLVKKDIEKRLFDSVEYALKLGQGVIKYLVGEDNDEYIFSEHYMSPKINKIYPNLDPKLFSFNSPLGACKKCNGLGELKTFDPDLIIKNPNLSLNQNPFSDIIDKNSFFYQMIKTFFIKEKISLDEPYKNLKIDQKNTIWKGSKKKYHFSFEDENTSYDFKKEFPGIIEWLNKKISETKSSKLIQHYEIFQKNSCCEICNGQKLNPIALNTRISSKNIMELSSLSIKDLLIFFKNLKLEKNKKQISKKIIKEIISRLTFLEDVGLSYLSLSRKSNSLSGGESQRIRLATQIGSTLSGVLYVLDEPSIGLHQKDNHLIIQTLKNLKELGNTVIVVEHEVETMYSSDFIVDMGPNAGIKGGEIVAQGTIDEIKKNKNSETGMYLSKKKIIKIPSKRKLLSKFVEIEGASLHNINNLNIKFPLEGFVCVTGVSGSGKTTLLNKILLPGMKKAVSEKTDTIKNSLFFKSMSGAKAIQSIVELDQSSIGKSPKSNPSTYTGLFNDIRKLFSETPESKIRGYSPNRFSFNIKGGRCEECEGNGQKKIEMHFLPDLYVLCNECNGQKFNKETLSIIYKGKNISEVLNFTVDEGLIFFQNHMRLNRILSTLSNIGLGYLKLGQPGNTLSGGEAQRLKLAKELSKKTKGNCLYILDEPTTGLHFKDIDILIKALFKLISDGHSIFIIEHNLEVIKMADHVIDLGPGGGDKGGKVVAQGTPEEISTKKNSYTGQFLKALL
tara:strand:+ start:2414 stop:5233 length:2820 start_codon:yes stop_codon:yes gene_type:complete